MIRSYLAAAALAAALGLPTSASAAERGVWLYYFPTTSFDNAALVSRLGDLLVNKVYLSMGNANQHRALDPGQTAYYDSAYVARLADFISRAHAAGISVHAMTLEAPDFTRTTYHALGRSLVGHLLVYNTNHASDAFDGIHLDVEPWDPSVWTGCCDLVTGDFAQLDALMVEYRALLADLRSDLDAHQTATGQDLTFSGTVPWWLNDEATIPDRVPNGRASVLATNLDVLVVLVAGTVGTNLATIIGAANDEVLAAPVEIGLYTDNLSYQDRAIAVTALNNLYAASANYRGTATFHFATLEQQYLSQ